MFDFEAVLGIVLSWISRHWIISGIIFIATLILIIPSRAWWHVLNEEREPGQKHSALLTLATITTYLVPLASMTLALLIAAAVVLSDG
jgi:hypothetical protein